MIYYIIFWVNVYELKKNVIYLIRQYIFNIKINEKKQYKKVKWMIFQTRIKERSSVQVESSVFVTSAEERKKEKQEKILLSFDKKTYEKASN